MITCRPERTDDAVHVVQSADEFGHTPLTDQTILYVKDGGKMNITSCDNGTHIRKAANNSNALRIAEKEKPNLVVSIDDVEEISTANAPYISTLNEKKQSHSFPEKLPPNKKTPSLEAQRHVI